MFSECEHGPERSYTYQNDCQRTKRILVHHPYMGECRRTGIIEKFNPADASSVTTPPSSVTLAHVMSDQEQFIVS